MNFLRFFQLTKRIYGICPCCDKAFRLSEVNLFTRTRPPRTAFDELDDAWEALARSEERLNARLDKIEDASRAEGQARARERLQTIAPFFTSHGIQPCDVKVLFDPIDYVAFCGLGGKDCSSIDFIDRPADSRVRESIQASLNSAIHKGNLEWRTYHITPRGSVEPS